MKIAVFGSGAIGGYFGGRLDPQAGHDVTFIARGSHLDAIKADGLQVKSIHGDFVIHPAKATNRPETVGSVDVVLCCVKILAGVRNRRKHPSALRAAIPWLFRCKTAWRHTLFYPGHWTLRIILCQGCAGSSA